MRQRLKEFFLDRWGLASFLVIAALGLGFNYYANRYQAQVADVVYHASMLYYLAGIYVVLVLAAWVSYPRIFKVRAFLAGPLFASVGIYSIMYVYKASRVLTFLTQATASVFFIETLLMVVAVNLVVLTLVPTFLEYRAVRKLGLGWLIGEMLVLLIWFSRYRDLSRPFEFFFTSYGPHLFALAAVVIVAASLWRTADDHQVGGALAGLAVWLAFLAPQIPQVQCFAFLLSLPAVLTAVIVHNLISSLHFRAQYDPLLKIYNRAFYQTIVHGQAHIDLGDEYCVAICDLDHFKQINDRAGHQYGDQVLERSAQAIRRQAGPASVVCRYGGEEIVVFFRNCGLAQAAVTCESIRKAVEKLPFKSGRRSVKVTVSIGVAAGKGTDDVSRVVAAADKALYQAKEQGRNRVVKAS